MTDIFRRIVIKSDNDFQFSERTNCLSLTVGPPFCFIVHLSIMINCFHLNEFTFPGWQLFRITRQESNRSQN